MSAAFLLIHRREAKIRRRGGIRLGTVAVSLVRGLHLGQIEDVSILTEFSRRGWLHQRAPAGENVKYVEENVTFGAVEKGGKLTRDHIKDPPVISLR